MKEVGSSSLLVNAHSSMPLELKQRVSGGNRRVAEKELGAKKAGAKSLSRHATVAAIALLQIKSLAKHVAKKASA